MCRPPACGARKTTHFLLFTRLLIPLGVALSVATPTNHRLVLSRRKCGSIQGKAVLQAVHASKTYTTGFKKWARADALLCLPYIWLHRKREQWQRLGHSCGEKIHRGTCKNGVCLGAFNNFFSLPEHLQTSLTKISMPLPLYRRTRKAFLWFPITKKTTKEGDHTYWVKGNVAALRRLVNALTTAHNPSHSVTASKKAKDGSKIDFQCPVAITDYTKYMHVLNRLAQLREYPTESRKSRKWWKWWMWLFYFIFDCALVNIPLKAGLVGKGQAHSLNDGPQSKSWRKILAWQKEPALQPHPISQKRQLLKGCRH